MPKDNWIKAFEDSDFCWTDFDGSRKLHTNRDITDQVKAFISQVENDAIEKTNKRWVSRINRKKKEIQYTADGMWDVKEVQEEAKLKLDVLSDLLEDTYKGEVGDLWEVGLPKDHPIFEDKSL